MTEGTPGNEWLVSDSNAGTIKLGGTSPFFCFAWSMSSFLLTPSYLDLCATVDYDGTLSMQDCFGSIRQSFSFY